MDSIYDSEGKHKKTLRQSQVKVVDYIEGTFNKIINDIQTRPCGRLTIVLKHATDLKPRGLDQCRAVHDKEMAISFPGKNGEEAWRFTCVGQILSEIHSALMAGEVITKRDLYYRNPDLFRSQKLVDRYVDIVAYTCGVTRLELNLTASPKGLVVGLHERGEAYELVPDMDPLELQRLIASIPHTAIWEWILVIEKEATLKSLVESVFCLSSNDVGRGLLLTGRGFPDTATQRFLRACADKQRPQPRQPPVLGLFDCDPYGIKILDVYRNGSKHLAEQRQSHVPEMKWIGLKPSDVFPLGDNDSAAIPLTARDVTMIKSMLLDDVEHTRGTGLGEESRLALQWMRMLNRKAEIQILGDRPGGLQRWLLKRIKQELVESS